MNPVEVKPSMCIDFGVGNNDKDTKFEVGRHLRIYKC